jgi:hypothetical protein
MPTSQSIVDAQDHDRLSIPEDAFAGDTMLSSKDDGAEQMVDISAGQKMLSAISGSLLTSLLGKLNLLSRQVLPREPFLSNFVLI